MIDKRQNPASFVLSDYENNFLFLFLFLLSEELERGVTKQGNSGVMGIEKNIGNLNFCFVKWVSFFQVYK